MVATDRVVAGRCWRHHLRHRFVDHGRAAQRGTVTAETALVLPLVAMFVLALLWMLTIGIAKVQTVDAARDAARVVARGDGTEAAVSAARHSAPQGADIAVHESAAGTVTATVTVEVEAPSWLLVPLPAVSVGSTATTPVEAGDVEL